MILYSRQDCPLCEDVEETLIRLNVDYQFIDIDLNEDLRKKYNAKVPVLVNELSEELLWPFEDDQIRLFGKL